MLNLITWSALLFPGNSACQGMSWLPKISASSDNSACCFGTVLCDGGLWLSVDLNLVPSFHLMHRKQLLLQPMRNVNPNNSSGTEHSEPLYWLLPPSIHLHSSLNASFHCCSLSSYFNLSQCVKWIIIIVLIFFHQHVTRWKFICQYTAFTVIYLKPSSNL